MIRVFTDRNKWTPIDDNAFVGEPPLFRPLDKSIPVMVSATFTWQIKEAQRIAKEWLVYYSNVKIGGPAFDDPGGEFEPGLFLKNGCVITTRGCPKHCGWCFVHKREGSLREIKIKPGWIVLDSNLLAASDQHIMAVFEMLKNQNRAIFFNGGLDKHFLKPWHIDLFNTIKIGELWFACDTFLDIPAFEKCSDMLTGIPFRKRRCYTMIGFNGETLYQAEQRLEKVLELGFMPFCQLYQPEIKIEYSKQWRMLARKWSRPAIYKSEWRKNHPKSC